MKVKVFVYALVDCEGNTEHVAVNDPSDKICIGGRDRDGVYRQFDSYEAYHVGEWAEKYGFVVRTAVLEYNPNELVWSE